MNRNNDNGKLIVFEGISGCGKSSQIELLQTRLKRDGIRVITSSWNSDPTITEIISHCKRTRIFTPITWSILQAADFAKRYVEIVLPALEDGMIVLLDRYIYTSIARDSIRGVDPSYIKKLYDYAKLPEGIIYIRTPVDVAFRRRINRYNKLAFYSSGGDVYGTKNLENSWMLYNEAISSQYDEFFREYTNILCINGTESVERIADQVYAFTMSIVKTRT